MSNRGLGVCERGFGAFVTVEIGRHGVHAAAANEGSLAIGETEISKKVGGGNGDGGVVRSGSSAIGKSTLNTASVHFAGFRSICKRGFHGECVGV